MCFFKNPNPNKYEQILASKFWKMLKRSNENKLPSIRLAKAILIILKIINNTNDYNNYFKRSLRNKFSKESENQFLNSVIQSIEKDDFNFRLSKRLILEYQKCFNYFYLNYNFKNSQDSNEFAKKSINYLNRNPQQGKNKDYNLSRNSVSAQKAESIGELRSIMDKNIYFKMDLKKDYKKEITNELKNGCMGNNSSCYSLNEKNQKASYQSIQKEINCIERSVWNYHSKSPELCNSHSIDSKLCLRNYFDQYIPQYKIEKGERENKYVSRYIKIIDNKESDLKSENNSIDSFESEELDEKTKLKGQLFKYNNPCSQKLKKGINKTSLIQKHTCLPFFSSNKFKNFVGLNEEEFTKEFCQFKKSEEKISKNLKEKSEEFKYSSLLKTLKDQIALYNKSKLGFSNEISIVNILKKG